MTHGRRRTAPVVESWDWQRRAACRGLDSALFFHPDSERGRVKAERDARAKQICHRRPVMAQCRTHALGTEEVYGVWGGLSETDRRTARPSSGSMPAL
ncbi:WhiB family transcriptional regulator [Amycolatopsis sp. FDAARGOS 1241]|uniref:WhiB family transcriptional regulator n=1 Tax=Amycolatopsis sp. FDAARGOS 1241 TaxID=2778070 RepID=UPI00194EF93D|nr:WhiB family transcriptional regulator [Amycolatopsis sp. FDAARGOS 1241]QRP47906.1 WhiB family transcriptional regulator [Amycolatopsis sp. FDAARGOS 1241]